MSDDVVPISSQVVERRRGRIGWAVVAAYVTGEHGDPVCVEYRVRQVRRGERMIDDVVALQQTLDAMEDHASQGLVGQGPFDPIGIPRYVFESASQGRLLEKARVSLSRGSRATEELSSEAKALLTPPAHKPGRPPQRSMGDKLKILRAIEEAQAAGQKLEDVAQQFHMSRSAVRDLLSWARRDANPRLFTGAGQGRKGGEMTPEARAMLSRIEAE